MSIRQFLADIRALAIAIPHLLSEFIAMNATVTEIESDLAATTTSLEALKTKVDGLETLTNNLFAQLTTLIIAGQPSVADLNALRDGLVSAKAKIDAESATVDATVTADSATPAAPTPST